MYIYVYRKSASRFSHGTVLNTLKQSRINITRGKKDATTFPDKPVSYTHTHTHTHICIYTYIIYKRLFKSSPLRNMNLS